MRVLIAAILALSGSTSNVLAQECGPGGSITGPGATINIAGSFSLFQLITDWGKGYKELCPKAIVNFQGGGSQNGAGRVCDNPARGSAVDIGAMSRGWTSGEGSTENGWKYNCLAGDSDRSAIQVDVAIEAIVVATENGGAADKCIETLGGLTKHQLRWIYSSYSAEQLEAKGWDPDSLPNTDCDDNTHLWSELDPSCTPNEIKFYGEDSLSELYEFFLMTILTDYEFGEKVDDARGYQAFNEDYSGLLHGEAIAFFAYSYNLLYEYREVISPVPIQNSYDQFVTPDDRSIGDGWYSPLSRRVTLNLYDDATSLAETRPFLAYALSTSGTKMVAKNGGLLPIPTFDKVVMLSRAGAEGGVDLSKISCGPPGGSLAIAGASAVFPVADIWAGIYDAACDVKIIVEGGNSTSGADRVCGNIAVGPAVDIGLMARDFLNLEATPKSPSFEYQCVTPNDDIRSVIQIDVAIDGIAIVVEEGGAADLCIQALGGLTIDQLRWMYSSYTSTELVNTGWARTSVANIDDDDSTHLWSELSDSLACTSTEIKIAGADIVSDVYTFFRDTVLKDYKEGEKFDTKYLGSAVEVVVPYLGFNGDAAIAYLSFSQYYANRGLLRVIPIQSESGEFVQPTYNTLSDRTYNPLSRRLHMTLFDDETALANSKPYIGFGLQNDGLVEAAGYIAIPSGDKVEMKLRLNKLQSVTFGGTVAPTTPTPPPVRPTPSPTIPQIPPDLSSSNSAFSCGPSGSIQIAGSVSVFPIADDWAEAYMALCPKVSISVEGGGSSVGAGKVCNNIFYGSAVDIGMMSRGWNSLEASTNNGWKYKCSRGDTLRSTIQVDVAIEAISVTTLISGIGSTCIAKLGGLTLDQLRWIYSSYTEAALKSTGWDSNSLPNSDGKNETHLWSELLDDEACAASEIHIGGADDFSDNYEFFLNTVLVDFANGETLDYDRPEQYFIARRGENILDLMTSSSIAYVGYSFFYSNRGYLSHVSIKNLNGQFASPDDQTILDGSYNPLARRITMNLFDDQTSLEKTRPFIQYGYSDFGTKAVYDTGFVPIPSYEKKVMLSRAGAVSGLDLSEVACGPTGGTITFGGSSVVAPIADVWAGVYGAACEITTKVDGGDSQGAGRVCANPNFGSAVDVGLMAEGWANQLMSNDGVYICLDPGDTSRSAIQIDVAIDSIVVFTQKGGGADSCIQALGGLTMDQLRWIYSNYTSADLIKTGWNSSSVPNNDGDDTTHFWSELSTDKACRSTGIKIAGADALSDTHAFFRKTVLLDEAKSETFRVSLFSGFAYVGGTVGVILPYVTFNEDAIAYLGFAPYYANRDKLSAVPIQNKNGKFIVPTISNLNDETYNPLNRRLYMNLLSSEAVLSKSYPLVSFGLSHDYLVESAGYLPIPESDKAIMLERLRNVSPPATPVFTAVPTSTPPTNPTGSPTAGTDGFACGPPDGTFSIAGSSTVFPLAKAWSQEYKALCPTVEIIVDDGGSSVGAGRVCNNPERGSAVDIGTMSRPWKFNEGSTANGWRYNCLKGDQSRSVIQIDVAIDGISIAVLKSSKASKCIAALGGLTTHQLRWMFSSYSAQQLIDTLWNENSLENSDGNDATHFWSELKDDPACPATEIKIAGSDVLSDTYEYFVEAILSDYQNGETVDVGRIGGYEYSELFDDLVAYLTNNEAAIAFFRFNYYDDGNSKLSVAGIKNEETGKFVTPSLETVGDGSYSPLSRRIYMNLYDDTDSLKQTRPFITFGLSDRGLTLVHSSGFVSIPQWATIVMLSRIEAVGGYVLGDIECGPAGGSITIAGSPNAFTVAQLWGGIYDAACDVKISVTDGDSSSGAGRVCGNPARGNPVMIGNMERQWKDNEASTSDGWRFRCLSPGDTSRSVIQVEIASDGLVVATQIRGDAFGCIEALGGLTLDQLRWIYSSYTIDELVNTGWDQSSLRNSDGNDETHLWSELLDKPACRPVPIRISGADTLSSTYELFKETILTDYINGETFAFNRPFGYMSTYEDDDLVDYLVAHDDAISYIGFSTFFFYTDRLAAVAIRNDAGKYIVPRASTVDDGTYTPLSRRMYMNLLDDPAALSQTRSFLAFGLSDEGSALVESLGYIPISNGRRIVMGARAGIGSSFGLGNVKCGPTGGNINIAGSDSGYSVSKIWAGVYDIACDTTVSLEDGGSTVGAARVCGRPNQGSPVEIGTMARQFLPSEASSLNGYLFNCLTPGDTSRSVIQVGIAINAITVATSFGGVAQKCIASLGGLTTDQLRWIYSNYDAKGLTDTGWNPASLLNSDGNDDTHLWSELSTNPACPATEIQISGADVLSSAHEQFGEAILRDFMNGEVFDVGRPGSVYFNSDYYQEDLADFLRSTNDGICYFDYDYYAQHQRYIVPVGIRNNAGRFVLPSEETLRDGSYTPLSRRIYMNLLDSASLVDTTPFIVFGFQNDYLVSATGLIPLSDDEKSMMLSRLGEEYVPPSLAEGPAAGSSGPNDGAIAGGVIGGLLFVMILTVVFRWFSKPDETFLPETECDPTPGTIPEIL